MAIKHTIGWVDIPTRDLDRATAFYSALLAVPLSVMSFGEFRMTLLPHEDDQVSGCLIESDTEPSDGGLLVYFSVEGRLAEATSIAGAMGGNILQPPHSIEPNGYRSIVRDSEGNRIALHSDTPPATTI